MKYTSISKEKYLDLVYKTGYMHDDISNLLIGIMIDDVIINYDSINFHSKNYRIALGCRDVTQLTIFKNTLNSGDIITEVIFKKEYIIIRSNNGILYFSGKGFDLENMQFECNINLLNYSNKYNNYKLLLSKYSNKIEIECYKYPKNGWFIFIIVEDIKFSILKDNYFLYETTMTDHRTYYLIDQIDGVIEFLKDKL